MKIHMKCLICFWCAVFLLCGLSSCEKAGPYEFWQPDDQIESIEIVNVYGKISEPLQYDVLVTITDHESFLEKFYELPFETVCLGDPVGPYGPSLCIKYKNGEYELIDYRGQYIVLSDATNDWYFGMRYCNSEDFLDLLTYFGYVG